MGHPQVLGLRGVNREIENSNEREPESYRGFGLRRVGYLAPAPAGPGW